MRRCRHRWQVKEKREQPSAAEQMRVGDAESIERAQPWVFHKSVIVHYVCADCGAEKVERV